MSNTPIDDIFKVRKVDDKFQLLMKTASEFGGGYVIMEEAKSMKTINNKIKRFYQVRALLNGNDTITIRMKE